VPVSIAHHWHLRETSEYTAKTFIANEKQQSVGEL